MLNKTKELYDNNIDKLSELSTEFNIPISSILAVLQVETNDDDGFSVVGGKRKLIIRFEAHKFFKYCTKEEKNLMADKFSFDFNQPWKKQKYRFNVELLSYHGNQDREYLVLDACNEVNPIAAYKSISMGLPQIMGFHYKLIGYKTPMDMHHYFSHGTSTQIQGMFDFMSNGMVKALRSGDYVKFARGYNGSGNAEKYGNLIELAEIKIRNDNTYYS